MKLYFKTLGSSNFFSLEGEEVKQFAGVVKSVGYRPKSVCFVADDDARTAYNRIGFGLETSNPTLYNVAKISGRLSIGDSRLLPHCLFNCLIFSAAYK